MNAQPTTVRVHHGCGCFSGLGSFLALAVLAFAAPKWLFTEEGVLFTLAGFIALVACLYWFWLKPQQVAAAAAAAATKAAASVAPAPALAPVVPAPVPPADEKACPDCGETVKAVARICRFCRHEFPA